MPNALADTYNQLDRSIGKSRNTGSGLAQNAGASQAIREAYTQYAQDRLDRNLEPIDFNMWVKTIREQYGMSPNVAGNALTSLGTRG